MLPATAVPDSSAGRKQERVEVSQTELARRIAAILGTKIDPSAINRIEQRTRTVRLDEAVAAAQALDLPLSVLLVEDPAEDNAAALKAYMAQLADAEAQWGRSRSLYFNATAALPANTIRTLVANAHNALVAMAGAEKMIASVYGIALTAMSFFTDPTISTLTSGRPSQTTDFGSLSFPRRMGVRFSQNYLKRDNLMRETRAVWSAYADANFTENLGPEFEHEDVVTREGWARYYFEGKFPKDTAWIKLELIDAQKQMLVRTFYFKFSKGYQLTLNGRRFVIEPVTGEKIVKDGVIRELRPVRDGEGVVTSYEEASTTDPQDRLNIADSDAPQRVTGQARAIQQTMVRYSEKPKAVFLVTPPHLMKYAQIVLICSSSWWI